jgi:hypothetical protein
LPGIFLEAGNKALNKENENHCGVGGDTKYVQKLPDTDENCGEK